MRALSAVVVSRGRLLAGNLTEQGRADPRYPWYLQLTIVDCAAA